MHSCARYRGEAQVTCTEAHHRDKRRLMLGKKETEQEEEHRGCLWPVDQGALRGTREEAYAGTPQKLRVCNLMKGAGSSPWL